MLVTDWIEIFVSRLSLLWWFGGFKITLWASERAWEGQLLLTERDLKYGSSCTFFLSFSAQGAVHAGHPAGQPGHPGYLVPVIHSVLQGRVYHRFGIFFFFTSEVPRNLRDRGLQWEILTIHSSGFIIKLFKYIFGHHKFHFQAKAVKVESCWDEVSKREDKIS